MTNLVNAGVPSHEARAVSGHRTQSVFNPAEGADAPRAPTADRDLEAQREAAEQKVIPLR